VAKKGDEPVPDAFTQGQSADHHWIESHIDAQWLQKGLSNHTLCSYRRDLEGLARYCAGRQLSLLDVQPSVLHDYLSVRYRHGYKPSSTARFLSSLRSFYNYLLEQEVIESNPASGLRNPSLGRPLPGTLTEAEVTSLLEAPDVDTALGMRDRAMLETLYGCGLRISELVGLKYTLVKPLHGVLRVSGKGSKDRMLPLGEMAIHWIQRFCRERRNEILHGNLSEFLFPGRGGRKMARQTFWHRIRKYAAMVPISSPLSPHTLRHAFATHMLNHDADLRVVQMLLGHSSLSTTQIYTHVARHRLQKIHAVHHPRG